MSLFAFGPRSTPTEGGIHSRLNGLSIVGIYWKARSANRVLLFVESMSTPAGWLILEHLGIR